MTQLQRSAPILLAAIWCVVLVTEAQASAEHLFSSVKRTGDNDCSVVFIGEDAFLAADHCATADCSKPCNSKCKKPRCFIYSGSDKRRVGNCSRRLYQDGLDLAICKLCYDTVSGPYETLSSAILKNGDKLRLFSREQGQSFSAIVSSIHDSGCLFTDSKSDSMDFDCPMRNGDSGSGVFRCKDESCQERTLVGIHVGKGPETKLKTKCSIRSGVCRGSGAPERDCRAVQITEEIVAWIKKWAKDNKAEPICGIDEEPARCRGG